MLPNKLGSLLQWGNTELADLGPEEARVSSERLFQEILGWDRIRLYLELQQEISTETQEKFRLLVARRKAREPLAYLLGKVSFWNETLEVGPGCLIPRPETELLIERFLEMAPFEKDFSFLDLGTGSGAIGIALLRHFTQAKGTLSDVSEEALKFTRLNLSRAGLISRAEVVCSEHFQNLLGRKWDAILSNPPYVARKDWLGLEPELLSEPREALDGGADGLDFYQRIARESREHLNVGGRIYLEVGIHQALEVSSLLKKNGFCEIEIHKDLAGIQRVVVAKK